MSKNSRRDSDIRLLLNLLPSFLASLAITHKYEFPLPETTLKSSEPENDNFLIFF